MLTITHLLNRNATIRRNAVTSDGQGGFTNALTTVDTVKGRRNPASNRERLVAGREEAEVTHVWYFDRGVVVLPRDYIDCDGVRDEVLASLPPSRDDFVKIAVKEIQLGATS